jgi:hypothetical protein
MALTAAEDPGTKQQHMQRLEREQLLLARGWFGHPGWLQLQSRCPLSAVSYNLPSFNANDVVWCVEPNTLRVVLLQTDKCPAEELSPEHLARGCGYCSIDITSIWDSWLLPADCTGLLLLNTAVAGCPVTD